MEKEDPRFNMSLEADVPEKIVLMANEGRVGGVDARGVVIPKKEELRDDIRVKKTGGGGRGKDGGGGGGKGKARKGKKKGKWR